jgi:hypothetical protein
MIPRQATATKLSSIRNRRTRLCTYSIESMAISSWVKAELSELQDDLQSEEVEISVGKGGDHGGKKFYLQVQLICRRVTDPFNARPARHLKANYSPVEPDIGHYKK